MTTQQAMRIRKPKPMISTPTPKQTQQGFATAARVAGVSRALTPPGLGTPWHSLKRVMRAPFGVYIVNA